MDVYDPNKFTSTHIPFWLMSLKEIDEWFEVEGMMLVLKSIRQDPKYHGEGNVYTHIRMVTNELLEHHLFQILPEHYQKCLLIAGWLHDIGKYLTTTEDDRGIHSYRHSLYSFKITQYFLFFTDIPLNCRYIISKLVQYHNSFIKWEKIKDLDSYLVRLSWYVSMELLLLLSECDNRGRICDDKEDILLGLSIVREQVKELDCLTKPYVLKNDTSRVLLGRKKLPYLDYVPYPIDDKRHSHVLMMSGFPGAGKTRFRTECISGLFHENNTYDDLVIICMDDIRKEFGVRPGDWKAEEKVGVKRIAKDRLREALRVGKPVVLDNLNLSKKGRTQWFDLALRYHARIEICYIEPPIQQCDHQNRNREDPVPGNVFIKKLRYELEYPNPLEAHIVQYYNGSTLFSPY